MVDGHAKGEVFKGLICDALVACPDLDVADLAWRWRAIFAARRLTADPPSDRADEVAALLVDAPIRVRREATAQ